MSPALFTWPVRVYYEDTDAQGLVYYANYFRFMERARTEWIRSLGIEQDRLMADDRRLFVVTRTETDFRRPARFNDELVITAELVSRARASFVLRQKVLRHARDGELCCEGTVRVAYLDADSLKPVKLPDSLFGLST